MGVNTNIEWCDSTINLWHGCTKVHAGCDNCYAEAHAKRFNNDIWGNDKPRLQIKSAYGELLKIQRNAQKENVIKRVFVGSMMDIFEKPMPVINHKGELQDYNTDVLRNQLFENIQNGLYPNLMFLFLTKRPSNINKYIPKIWTVNPPDNVMFGTSPVNQKTFDDLVLQLSRVNGKKFLSIEPQLSDIKLHAFTYKEIGWIIQGGESGYGRRPFNIEWAYSLRDQCKEQGIPYFFKQIDKIQAIPEDLNIKEFYK